MPDTIDSRNPMQAIGRASSLYTRMIIMSLHHERISLTLNLHVWYDLAGDSSQ